MQNLCLICQFRQRTVEGMTCSKAAPSTALLEAGQPVNVCATFRRTGDGKQLLVDTDGRVQQRGS